MLHAERGREAPSKSHEVLKQVLVGQQQAGTQAMMQVEGML